MRCKMMTAASNGTTSVPKGRRKKKASSFNDLALATLQAISPQKRLTHGDIQLDKVRKLVADFVQNKATKSPSNGSAQSSPRLTNTSSGDNTGNDASSSSSWTSPEGVQLRARRPDGSEPDKEGSLGCLVKGALSEADAAQSFRRVIDALRERYTSQQRDLDSLDGLIYAFLNSEALPNEIVEELPPEKNIQSIQVHVCLELFKLQLLSKLQNKAANVQECKVLSKLRYLSVVTNATLLEQFVCQVLDPQFGPHLRDQLQELHTRLGVPYKASCVDMPPTGAIDLEKRLSPVEPAEIQSPKNSFGTDVLERRSNGIARQQSVPDADSLSRTSSRKLSSVSRKLSSASTKSSKVSFAPEEEIIQESEISSNVEDVELKSDRDPSVETVDESNNHLEADITPKEELPATSGPIRLRKKKEAFKVEAKGSIASRRQSRKRLCVISRSTGLIQPASTRSATANVLHRQKQQNDWMYTKRRSVVLENLPATPVEEKASKLKLAVKDAEEAKPKPPRRRRVILNDDALKRYKQRMNEVWKAAKQLSEHEVFYGRCNARRSLFEDTEEQKTLAQCSKQKNRSGRSTIKNQNSDLLYFAHTLLNTENPTPLASGLPKMARANPLGEFRVKKLVRHANRAQILRFNKHIQRHEQQQQALLSQVKKEREGSQED